MSPTDRTTYRRGVMDVLAIITTSATQLDASELSILRRELVVETLRAIAEEGRVLINWQAPPESKVDWS